MSHAVKCCEHKTKNPRHRVNIKEKEREKERERDLEGERFFVYIYIRDILGQTMSWWTSSWGGSGGGGGSSWGSNRAKDDTNKYKDGYPKEDLDDLTKDWNWVRLVFLLLLFHSPFLGNLTVLHIPRAFSCILPTFPYRFES